MTKSVVKKWGMWREWEAGKEVGGGKGKVRKTLAKWNYWGVGQIIGSSSLVIGDDNSPNLLSDHNLICITDTVSELGVEMLGT